MTSPLLRMLVGLGFGFAGAFATITGIEWLDDDRLSTDVPTVVGTPDFDGYCEVRGFRLIELGPSVDRWRCGGRLAGFWTVTPVDPQDVCREQFATTARELDREGSNRWSCLASP